MLGEHNRKQQWVDITLGMTKKQMDNCDKELAAIARRDKELDQEYNFEGGHSVNPGDGHKDDGTAITLTMRISLKDSAYDFDKIEDKLSLSDLEADLYKDDQGTGGMDFEMVQVHPDVGRKIATTLSSEEGGSGLSSISTDRNKENPDLSHGDEGRGTSDTAQLPTDLESTTL